MRGISGLFLSCVLGFGLFGVAGASAQEMIDAKDPERIAAVLKGFGIARVGETSDGNPQISGRSDGKKYEVFFFDCVENKDCRNIQFWAYWDQSASLESLNEWNKMTRFGRVYLDEDDDVVLEFAVDLSYGIDERTLEDNADVWVKMMAGVERDLITR